MSTVGATGRRAPTGTAGVPGEVAVRLREVTKRYPGTDRPAVDRLSLDIPAGAVTAFVGPSGCGKTTTLKMINRLIEPTSGVIEVLGRPHDAVPAHVLRRSIGYVIQQVGLFPHRTVAENIATVPRLLGWDRRRIEARVAELIDLVGLTPDLADRYPAELSGGQQQRVGVARALAADPPILLMDEPYSAVDPIVRARLQRELLDLQDRLGKTIVVVTHDIDEAILLGDLVAVFGDGGVLHQVADPDTLLREPADAFVASFLGSGRGLRRLSLVTVAEVPLEPGPVVPPEASGAEVTEVMERHGTTWALVVDDGALLGWVGRDDLNGVPARAVCRPMEATVTLATPLRDALDRIVLSPVLAAAVVDGTFRGVVTLDEVAAGLR